MVPVPAAGRSICNGSIAIACQLGPLQIVEASVPLDEDCVYRQQEETELITRFVYE